MHYSEAPVLSVDLMMQCTPSTWNPQGVVLHAGGIRNCTKAQKRAARFVRGNYNNKTGIMTGILV